ncbi:MAG: SGNH/GDSL hydrolase family protein [Halobacteriaceae archaeon]
MIHDGLSFHNVTDLRAVEDRAGLVIQRVPERTRVELNEGAQDNYRRPAGSEIRFVPEGTVEVTLSAPEHATEVRPFWGPFQAREQFEIGEEPTTIELEFPERLADVREDVADDYAHHPRVCRLVLPHRSKPVFYHGVAGDTRPPREAELPDQTLLAYGTSITRGIAATAPHLTYVAQTARRLGTDALNLGTAGSAFCEPEIADHMAARDDWDAATLALSVNMVAGFDVPEFRERVRYVVETVAGENPERPVVAITLFPYFPDLCTGDHEDHANYGAYRDALREAVAEADCDNLHLVEGPDLMPGGRGLTTDLVHPGDDAMIDVGVALADELAPLLEGGR